MTDRELMQQALDRMEGVRVFVTTKERIKQPEGCDWFDETITYLREQLAQTEPSEPDDGLIQALSERDTYHAAADALAAAIAAITGAEIGEHSSVNDPWQNALDAASEYQQAAPATVKDDSQHWAGMDGAVAWHLIERHADNWTDVSQMMHEWLAANQEAPIHTASPAPTKAEPVAWLDPIRMSAIGNPQKQTALASIAPGLVAIAEAHTEPLCRCSDLASRAPDAFAFVKNGKVLAAGIRAGAPTMDGGIWEPLYLAPQPDALRESHARLVDALEWIASLKTGGMIERRALEALAAAKEKNNG